MAIHTVPDYFQEGTEEAMRSQVRWLQSELGIRMEFFPQFLKLDPAEFLAWQEAREPLADSASADLRSLWQTALHLMSFVNFDVRKARQMIEYRAVDMGNSGHVPECCGSSVFAPPWLGSSIKAHIANHGASGLVDVDRWFSVLRFGNPYAA